MRKTLLRRSLGAWCVLMLVAALAAPLAAQDKMIGINVLLNRPIDDAIVADLKKVGNVGHKLYEINALLMTARENQLEAIRAKPYVKAADPDSEREGKPIDTVGATNFSVAVNTWDQDAINVSNFGSFTRQVAFNGSGVNVAVLDTGLLDTWRQYFPNERILSQYAISLQGGGAFSAGAISVSPNKWEHDTSSHGTHVTSTILGYSFFGTPIHGVAPLANVIPVKVLNQNGSGFSSVIAVGILYATALKLGPLAGSPMIIKHESERTCGECGRKGGYRLRGSQWSDHRGLGRQPGKHRSTLSRRVRAGDFCGFGRLDRSVVSRRQPQPLVVRQQRPRSDVGKRLLHLQLLQP